MLLPEQQYFTLAELAERWKTTESRILEMLLNSQLWAVALVSGIAYTSWRDEAGNWHDSTAPQKLELRTWLDSDLLFSIFKNGEGQTYWAVDNGQGYKFQEPVRITKEELLVTRKELERFETEHSCGPEDRGAAPHEDISELKRTQRALAALAIGLAGKYEAYRSGDKPNASQLARLATEHLRDATSDRTPHGFSETTVRQAIAAALNACPELTK